MLLLIVGAAKLSSTRPEVVGAPLRRTEKCLHVKLCGLCAFALAVTAHTDFLLMQFIRAALNSHTRVCIAHLSLAKRFTYNV